MNTVNTCIFNWQKGQRIGDVFELGERLGKGTFGIVGRARRLKAGKKARKGQVVALKIPFDQELGIESLKREPEVLLQCQHEHIVQVFEYHVISSCFIIEMELVEGHNLATILRNGNHTNPGDLATYLRWMRQCASALQAMGEYAHGDIKPQNILIREDGILKLVDFGTSRRMEDIQVYTTGRGTEQYMAPEVALDNKRISIKSDMYSLGIVLYEIVTGDVPYRTNLEIYQGKTLTKPRELNPSIPVDLETLILRCLERDPDGRFTSWHDLIASLNSVVDELSAAPQTVAPRPVAHPEFAPPPSSPLYFLEQAKAYIDDAQFAEAVTFAEKAVDASEGHPSYLKLLGSIALKVGYHRKAAEALTRLLAKYDAGYPAEGSELEHLLSRLADTEIVLKEYDLAIAHLARLTEISVNQAYAKLKLAVAHGMSGDYRSAIARLEEVRELRPDSAVVYSKLGWANALNGNFSVAVSYYNQALVIDPSDTFSLFELGRYYRIRGERSRAEKYLHEAISADASGQYTDRAKVLLES